MIDPIGDGPFVWRTETQDHAKNSTALESTIIANKNDVLLPGYTLTHFTIIEAAFKGAGGIILFLVALDMLVAKRQHNAGSTTAHHSYCSRKPRHLSASHPASRRTVGYHVSDCRRYGACQRINAVGYAALWLMVATEHPLPNRDR